VTLLGQGVGLGDPQRSLPTPTILWFCKYSFITFYSYFKTANRLRTHTYTLACLPTPLSAALADSPQRSLTSVTAGDPSARTMPALTRCWSQPSRRRHGAFHTAAMICLRVTDSTCDRGGKKHTCTFWKQHTVVIFIPCRGKTKSVS